MNVPRSDLLQRVLISLSDHPHDDTVERLTRQLGVVDPDAVTAALTVLADDGLASSARRARLPITPPIWRAGAASRTLGPRLDSGWC